MFRMIFALIFLLWLSVSVAMAQAIGISYDQVMASFDGGIIVEKSTPVRGEDRYMGSTADKLATLEIIGPKINISKASLVLGVGVSDAPAGIIERNERFILHFLKNTMPEWKGSSEWGRYARKEALKTLTSPKTIIKGNKIATLNYLKHTGALIITIRHK